MADNNQKNRRTELQISKPICGRRIWTLFIYAILLFSLWKVLRHILHWYTQKIQSPFSSPSGWPSFYVSVPLVAVFGLVSMASALAVIVPAALVTWITIVVFLSFIGKSRRALVAEGTKITKEIILCLVVKIVLKECNVLAAVCAVLGYLAVFKNGLI